MSGEYIQDLKRENAMMFVISLGMMISDVMNHVLKSMELDITADGITIHMSS